VPLLLVVAKTFSAVVLTVTGTFLLAGSLLLILLGG
jgi:hypothetical protein